MQSNFLSPLNFVLIKPTDKGLYLSQSAIVSTKSCTYVQLIGMPDSTMYYIIPTLFAYFLACHPWLHLVTFSINVFYFLLCVLFLGYS